MKLIKNILILLCFLKIIILSNQKLLFVNVHFRHGARGPIFLVNKEGADLFGNKWAKRGVLTPKGKRQVFLNGIKHREKYFEFINEEYIEDEIKAYSTDSYRAISSLECYLNGLYYNNDLKGNIIKDGLTIYPPGNISENMKKTVEQLGINALPKDNHIIPINIFQKSDHSFVLHEPAKISDCHIIGDIRKKLTSDYKYKKLINEFIEKFGKNLSNFFGSNNITINFTSDKIHLLCDSFYSDLTDNRDMSSLEKEGIKIEELKEYCNNILSIVQKEIVSGDRNVVMMSQTPPIKKLLKWMDERIELDKKGVPDKIIAGSPKFTIWSGHDSSISTMQMFMYYNFGTKWSFPFFASSILFELYKNDNDKNEYELRYYVNDALLFKIDYYKFKNKVNENLWSQEQIDNFCQFSIINISERNRKFYWIISFLVLLLIISAVFNIKNFLDNRKKIKEN